MIPVGVGIDDDIDDTRSGTQAVPQDKWYRQTWHSLVPTDMAFVGTDRHGIHWCQQTWHSLVPTNVTFVNATDDNVTIV